MNRVSRETRLQFTRPLVGEFQGASTGNWFFKLEVESRLVRISFIQIKAVDYCLLLSIIE